MKAALVIDDHWTIRRAGARMLKHFGFEVHEARDGETGLALDGATPLDLVLVDWRMPGLSGLDVVEAIRATDHHQATRLIMVTAVDDVIAVAAALVAGVDAYVVKPVSERALRSRLEQLGLLMAAA